MKEIQGKVILDSFAEAVGNLPKGKRTDLDILQALSKNPRISFWDVSETAWIRNGIDSLTRDGYIVSVDAPYPSWQWEITEKGREALKPSPEPLKQICP